MEKTFPELRAACDNARTLVHDTSLTYAMLLMIIEDILKVAVSDGYADPGQGGWHYDENDSEDERIVSQCRSKTNPDCPLLSITFRFNGDYIRVTDVICDL